MGQLPANDRADANVDSGASEPPAKDNARVYRAFDFGQAPEFFTIFGSTFSLTQRSF
jgi:hypothetical protein